MRSRREHERRGPGVFVEDRLESRSTVHRVGDEDDGPGPGSAGRVGRGSGGVIGVLGGPAVERVFLRQVESEVDPRDLNIMGDLGERKQEALRVPEHPGQAKASGVGHILTVTNGARSSLGSADSSPCERLTAARMPRVASAPPSGNSRAGGQPRSSARPASMTSKASCRSSSEIVSGGRKRRMLP